MECIRNTISCLVWCRQSPRVLACCQLFIFLTLYVGFLCVYSLIFVIPIYNQHYEVDWGLIFKRVVWAWLFLATVPYLLPVACTFIYKVCLESDNIVAAIAEFHAKTSTLNWSSWLGPCDAFQLLRRYSARWDEQDSAEVDALNNSPAGIVRLCRIAWICLRQLGFALLLVTAMALLYLTALAILFLRFCLLTLERACVSLFGWQINFLTTAVASGLESARAVGLSVYRSVCYFTIVYVSPACKFLWNGKSKPLAISIWLAGAIITFGLGVFRPESPSPFYVKMGLVVAHFALPAYRSAKFLASKQFARGIDSYHLSRDRVRYLQTNLVVALTWPLSATGLILIFSTDPSKGLVLFDRITLAAGAFLVLVSLSVIIAILAFKCGPDVAPLLQAAGAHQFQRVPNEEPGIPEEPVRLPDIAPTRHAHPVPAIVDCAAEWEYIQHFCANSDVKAQSQEEARLEHYTQVRDLQEQWDRDAASAIKFAQSLLQVQRGLTSGGAEGRLTDADVKQRVCNTISNPALRRHVEATQSVVVLSADGTVDNALSSAAWVHRVEASVAEAILDPARVPSAVNIKTLIHVTVRDDEAPYRQAASASASASVSASSLGGTVFTLFPTTTLDRLFQAWSQLQPSSFVVDNSHRLYFTYLFNRLEGGQTAAQAGLQDGAQICVCRPTILARMRAAGGRQPYRSAPASASTPLRSRLADYGSSGGGLLPFRPMDSSENDNSVMMSLASHSGEESKQDPSIVAASMFQTRTRALTTASSQVSSLALPPGFEDVPLTDLSSRARANTNNSAAFNPSPIRSAAASTSISTGTVQEIFREGGLDDVLGSSQLVALAVHGHIRGQQNNPWPRVAQHFSELAAANRDVAFFKFNGESWILSGLKDKLRIQAFPTFVFFVRGRRVASLIGAQPLEIEEEIAKMRALLRRIGGPSLV